MDNVRTDIGNISRGEPTGTRDSIPREASSADPELLRDYCISVATGVGILNIRMVLVNGEIFRSGLPQGNVAPEVRGKRDIGITRVASHRNLRWWSRGEHSSEASPHEHIARRETWQPVTWWAL